MPDICSTCLSQDRSLKRLDSLKKGTTLEWLQADFLSPEHTMLCWECESDLNHAEKFRQRAVVAQDILKTRVHDGQIKSLSTLSSCEAMEDSTIPKPVDILKKISKNNVKINRKHKNICHIAEIDVIKVDDYDETSKVKEEIKNMIEILNKDFDKPNKDFKKLFSIIEEVDPRVIETDIEPEVYATEPIETEQIDEHDDDEPLAKIQKLTNTLIEPVKNNIVVHNVYEPIVDLSEQDYDVNDFDMDDPNFMGIMEPIIDITEPGIPTEDPISLNDHVTKDNVKQGWPVLTLEGQKVTNVNTTPNINQVYSTNKIHDSKIIPIPITRLTNFDPTKLKPVSPQNLPPGLRKIPPGLKNLPPGLIKLQNIINTHKMAATTTSNVSKLSLLQADQKKRKEAKNLIQVPLLQNKELILKQIEDKSKVLDIKPDVLKQAQTSEIPVFKIPKTGDILHRKKESVKLYEEIRVYNPQKIKNSMTKKARNQQDGPAAAKCRACFQCFETQAEFDAHLEQFHSEAAGPYICSICTIRFQKEELLKSHYIDHTDLENDYKCKICAFKHHDRDTMEAHVRDTHKLKKCQFCSTKFKTQQQLSDHVIRRHMSNKELRKFKPQMPSCHKCVRTFTRPYLLERHMQTCHPGEGVLCHVCLKFVPELTEHMKIHGRPADKEGTCLLCKKSFPRIEYHMMAEHPDWQEDAYCKECEVQYTSKKLYHVHLKKSKVHQTATKFICEHCARSFPKAWRLAEHVATIHENKLIYSCDTCKQAFARKYLLRAHIKTAHKAKNTRDHVCHECGAAFFKVSILKSHMLIHAPVKPYHCAHCEWQFSTRGAFITHLRGKHPEVVVPKAKLVK